MNTVPSEETTTALKEWILLRYVLSVFDRDKKAIAASKVKFPHVYLDLIENADKAAHADMVRCKQTFTRNGLKVLDEVTTTIDVTVKYVYRGYTGQKVYIVANLAAETEVRVGQYLLENKIAPDAT